MTTKKIKVVLTPDPKETRLVSQLVTGTVFRDEDDDLCVRVSGGFVTLRCFGFHTFAGCFKDQKIKEIFGTLDVVVGPAPASYADDSIDEDVDEDGDDE